ncbi:MAG: hypothetical protein SFU83_08590 [Meiothermus sp.]|nr:hypothetical protein [Meiothermus sp.]
MTQREFINRVGSLYTRVGRPPLEGRFVALLLLAEGPVAVARAAEQLGVTRQALQRLAVEMLERGDLKREGEFSTKRHLYSLADHAYSRDLRAHLDAITEVSELAEEMLGRARAGGDAALHLRAHAELTRRAAESLRGLVESHERAREADLEAHLERNWDAVPARRGAGSMGGGEREEGKKESN